MSFGEPFMKALSGNDSIYMVHSTSSAPTLFATPIPKPTITTMADNSTRSSKSDAQILQSLYNAATLVPVTVLRDGRAFMWVPTGKSSVSAVSFVPEADAVRSIRDAVQRCTSAPSPFNSPSRPAKSCLDTKSTKSSAQPSNSFASELLKNTQLLRTLIPSGPITEIPMALDERPTADRKMLNDFFTSYLDGAHDVCEGLGGKLAKMTQSEWNNICKLTSTMYSGNGDSKTDLYCTEAQLNRHLLEHTMGGAKTIDALLKDRAADIPVMMGSVALGAVEELATSLASKLDDTNTTDVQRALIKDVLERATRKSSAAVDSAKNWRRVNMLSDSCVGSESDVETARLGSHTSPLTARA